MKTPNYYHDVFNKPIAKIYDITLPIMMFGKEMSTKKKILDLFPKNPKNILDLACGTGTLAIGIKKEYKNANVYGVDLSKLMLERAIKKAKNKKLEIKFSLQNVEKMSFRSSSFDVITASLALHEIPLKNLRNVIKEIYRLLRKNGIFIILDIHKPGVWLTKKVFLWYLKKTEPHGMGFINWDLIKLFKKFKLIKRSIELRGAVQLLSFKKIS